VPFHCSISSLSSISLSLSKISTTRTRSQLLKEFSGKWMLLIEWCAVNCGRWSCRSCYNWFYWLWRWIGFSIKTPGRQQKIVRNVKEVADLVYYNVAVFFFLYSCNRGRCGTALLCFQSSMFWLHLKVPLAITRRSQAATFMPGFTSSIINSIKLG
jgi:hypothetical protein